MCSCSMSNVMWQDFTTQPTTTLRATADAATTTRDVLLQSNTAKYSLTIITQFIVTIQGVPRVKVTTSGECSLC